MIAKTSSGELSNRSKIIFLAMGIGISCLIGLGEYFHVNLLQNLDNLFYDTYLSKTADPNFSDTITIIDIDEVSLSAFGQWPWPRYKIAFLIEKIAKHRPAAIAVDIIFSEPDRSALVNITKTFKNDFDLDLKFLGVPDQLTDNDRYLGYVMANSDTVGSNLFYFDHFNKTQNCENTTTFQVTGNLDKLELHKAPGMLCNTDSIASGLKYRGFVNNYFDDDSLLRRLPLMIDFKGVIHPNLSLAAFLQANNIKTTSLGSNFFGPVLYVGDHSIPINQKGYTFLKFNGPGRSFRYISALDLNKGAFKPSQITGKTVLIGSSSISLNDLHHTMFDLQFPGIETHAVFIDNLLSGGFVQKPIWSDSFILACCLGAGLILSLVFIVVSSPAFAIAGTLGLSLLFLCASLTLFVLKNVFISPGSPIVTIFTLFIIFSGIRYVYEKRQSYFWFRELAKIQQLTLESMANVAETRDPETGAHIKRTQHYVRALASYLLKKRAYPELLSEDFVDLLYISAPLHDVGKVGVPDHILLKPGRLNEEEFAIMKRHTNYGRDIIEASASKLDGDNFLKLASEIAISHHERWDGSGYPLGLSGDDIPLSGRLMAITDVYDALISQRCYKPAFSHQKAMDLIKQGHGTHFDPNIVDAFLQIEDRLLAIASKYRDSGEEILSIADETANSEIMDNMMEEDSW